MSSTPKLNDDHTIRVKRQKRFGRVDYEPVNKLATQFLEGIKQKSFVHNDLKWIKSLGYTILIVGDETEEF